jgi:hypothetical protein
MHVRLKSTATGVQPFEVLVRPYVAPFGRIGLVRMVAEAGTLTERITPCRDFRRSVETILTIRARGAPPVRRYFLRREPPRA